jgi:hypothetical protein
MMTPESYLLGWLIYLAATLCGLALLYAWVGPRMSRGVRLAVAALLAGLVLTPAQPDVTIDSWAPALFVVTFDLLGDGTDAAVRALRPILFVESAVFACILLIYAARRIAR